MHKSYFYYLKLLIVAAISLILVTACHSHLYQKPNLLKASLRNPECQLVKHELGETCVPIKPQRILVTDQVSLEIVLALGLKPIASPDPGFIGSKANFLGQQMEGVNYIGKENQLNIEKIVYLYPDLIIGLYNLSSESYNLFSQIAPVIKLKYNQIYWKDALRETGRILGRSEQAEKLITQYQKRIEDLKIALGEKLNQIKVSIGRFHGQVQSAEFRSQFSFPGSILSEIGLSLPEEQRKLIKQPSDNFIIVSFERIDLLDADFFFVAVDPGAKELFKKYQKHELWQQLKASKNKRIYLVDSSYWIFGNILSANAILDDLSKYLLSEIQQGTGNREQGTELKVY
ncbi:MAG TPA: iron-siderophore ABC transporter substrate-binding protein [Nostocaceae cyanobacterium]|nr:iron-siderophore ABC transporter substrate-binding protein [Nostocaceae cyanobacterium]